MLAVERLDIDDVADFQHLLTLRGTLPRSARRGFAHFTPSSAMMPTSRSSDSAPPGSRAGLQADARR